MFNKSDKELAIGKEAETIIGPSVKVKGNFHGDGNMVIEGQVEGSIKTKGSLYVGDRAQIAATIEAKEARIGGQITGNIKVTGLLEVSASSVINGDVEAGLLSVEKGARLSGRLMMGGAGKSEAPSA